MALSFLFVLPVWSTDFNILGKQKWNLYLNTTKQTSQCMENVSRKQLEVTKTYEMQMLPTKNKAKLDKVTPLSHRRLSRRRLVFQRQTASLPCSDDYKKCRRDVGHTVRIIWKWTRSTMLELEEIIAVWARRELKKKKKCGCTLICDRGDSGVFGTIFGDLRRDEAEFLKYFRMPVDSWRTVWHNWVLSRKNKRQMWGHLYHAATERQ